jgi:hypothetical protein
MKQFWHYTTPDRLEEILNSEVIKATKLNSTNKKEPSTCWVSKNPIWEPTATKAVMDENGERVQLTMNEQIEILGLARIEIEPTTPLISWMKYKHISKGNWALLDLMEKHGISIGARPGDWFCSLKPISINHWIRAEVWENGSWKEIEYFEEI